MRARFQAFGPTRPAGASNVCHWTSFQRIHDGRKRCSSGLWSRTSWATCSGEREIADQSSISDGVSIVNRGETSQVVARQTTAAPTTRAPARIHPRPLPSRCVTAGPSSARSPTATAPTAVAA